MCTRLPVRRPNCCVPAGTGEFFLARSLPIFTRLFLSPASAGPSSASASGAAGSYRRLQASEKKWRFTRREWKSGKEGKKDELVSAYQTSQFTPSGAVMTVKSGCRVGAGSSTLLSPVVDSGIAMPV